MVCCICLETPNDPFYCTSASPHACKQLIGCTPCCIGWAQKTPPTCPLCRCILAIPPDPQPAIPCPSLRIVLRQVHFLRMKVLGIGEPYGYGSQIVRIACRSHDGTEIYQIIASGANKDRLTGRIRINSVTFLIFKKSAV